MVCQYIYTTVPARVFIILNFYYFYTGKYCSHRGSQSTNYGICTRVLFCRMILHLHMHTVEIIATIFLEHTGLYRCTLFVNVYIFLTFKIRGIAKQKNVSLENLGVRLNRR